LTSKKKCFNHEPCVKSAIYIAKKQSFSTVELQLIFVDVFDWPNISIYYAPPKATHLYSLAEIVKVRKVKSSRYGSGCTLNGVSFKNVY
jgi:hypothetical protein